MTDKIGYLILILCIMYVYISYGKFFIYDTLCLLACNEMENYVVLERENIDDLYVYKLKQTTYITSSTVFTSAPIKKNILIGSITTGRIVPFFNKIILKKVDYISYLLLSFLFYFMLLVAYISICMILGADNFFTRKIKEADKLKKYEES